MREVIESHMYLIINARRGMEELGSITPIITPPSGAAPTGAELSLWSCPARICAPADIISTENMNLPSVHGEDSGALEFAIVRKYTEN